MFERRRMINGQSSLLTMLYLVHLYSLAFDPACHSSIMFLLFYCTYGFYLPSNDCFNCYVSVFLVIILLLCTALL